MRKFCIIIMITFAFTALAGCEGKSNHRAGKPSSFKDPRDGKEYKTVKIGEQVWMAENLNFDGIGLCYDSIPENCEKYGKLYNWEEAMIACPKGWHLPSDEEWQKLIDFAGGDSIAGASLKAKNGWKEKQKIWGWPEEYLICGYSGNNSNGEYVQYECDHFGFAALPGGFRWNDSGNFYHDSVAGYWWSAYDEDSLALLRHMFYSVATMYQLATTKSALCSVRCIQDIQ